MIRLSEALARLHCDDEIQPSYVREAFRLLQKSIIHVETQDVTFENEVSDDEVLGNDDENEEGGIPMESEPASHPGEYTNEMEETQGVSGEGNDAVETQETAPIPIKKKKKTQITFEEFESISNAIATYLRSLESDDEKTESKYLTWREVVDWYLEQREEEIGDSMEELERMRKVINLVIRRLINVDHVLIYIGDGPSTKVQEQETKIAVHPNYVMS
jgi:DNA replication licensing factor MCM6